MSLLEDVFSLTKEEQIALLDELEKKASVASPIALPQEVIETFELPDEVDIEDELAKIKEIVLAEIQSVTINAPKGDKGNKGDKGDKGDVGPRGLDGKDGKQGKEGKDGVNGTDGISVTDARVDFDGTLVITLSNGQEINAGDVIPNDKKELVIQSLKNGALSLTELGIEEFLSSPTPIGDVTPNTGAFTSVTTPSVTATTNNLTLSAISTGNVNLATLGGTQFKAIEATGSVNVWNVRGGDGSTTSPRFTTEGTGTNIAGQFNTKGTGALQFFSGNTEQMRITNTASAVNYVQVTGSSTGNQAVISVQGSDTNVPLAIAAKGSGTINLQQTTSIGRSATNWLAINGSTASGNAVQANIFGADTNVSLALQPKGTGAIDLAAGSRGVNISNGGTVTAITVTNGGTTAYTSHPTPAITAPTTAGGVQAVATSNLFYNSALASTTIVNGGTGYTVGNLLTVVGGTSTATAQFTVSAVSSGVVTAITGASGGTYSVIPTGTLSVTGGSGTGFTFTINGWAVRSLNITNAGSGYIEQPTVTFSGGGGSGASAYATVGSGTTVKTLGSSISFNVPSSEVLRLTDGTSAACYLNLQSSSTTIQGFASSSGSNVGYQWVTKGVSNHSFATNNSVSNEQFRVSHTASAVNYVQVTGSPTSAGASALGGILFTGSDTNVNGAITMKGTGYITFSGSGLTASQAFRVNTTNAVTTGNLLQVQGAAAGSSPSIQAINGPTGTDANIDIILTPKGTGVVRFGTYTANMALTVQGYIEIKDSGGTLRKLAVIA